MIKGEIIAMKNRLHGCVFVIVIGGIDIITQRPLKEQNVGTGTKT